MASIKRGLIRMIDAGKGQSLNQDRMVIPSFSAD